MTNQTLAERLSDRIRREGPITFRDWMAMVLYDERQGYYSRKDLARWGRSGDYRTSPETSVLFAATFARYFAQLFTELGSPGIFTIVEMGGGSGQFAAHVLDNLERRFSAVFDRLNYVFDEISNDARGRAAEQVARFHKRVRFEYLSEIGPIDAGIVFSNELIDAFPVHRIGLREGKLFEFYVGLSDNGSFKWVDGPISSPRLPGYLKRFRLQLRDGQVIEINLALEDWYHQVAKKLRRGYVVTVDYGYEAEELHGPARDHGTLRAYRRHRLTEDILNSPGVQDITSTVDWTVMREIGMELGFELVTIERQDRFLLNRGLLEELELRVAEVESEAERMRLRTSVREMILPGGLAGSFQVLVQRTVTDEKK
jgi:SAM-dependent MidA family methyltransferase